MRILFITDNFPPEMNAPASRTYEHCKEWIRAGVDVTVITGFPNFPNGKVFDGYTNQVMKRENMDGIQVVRVWSYMNANEGFVRRSLDYMSFAFSSFFWGLFQKADVIIATSPQFFTTWTAYLLAKLKRKPWIFELRDLWPESIATVGAMKEGQLFRVLESIELGLYRNADIVVPNTPAFKKNLIRRGIDSGKIHVIENGASLEQFLPQKKDARLLRELKLENKFIYGYIGTHGMAHSLDFIIESISKLTNPDIHFLFIGDGAEKKRVVSKASELGCNNVTFLDSIEKREVARHLAITDAALVPLKKCETFKSVIPSKIFEACAMKKPILLGVDGQAREIVEYFGAGLYFEPENEASFIQNAEKLATDRNLYERVSANAAKLADQYNRKDLAREMLLVIDECVNTASFDRKAG